MAFNHIRNGKPLIDTQLDSGFESSNGFRDAFTRIMGAVPKRNKQVKLLTAKWIETKLGSMIAIADDDGLYLLEFVDRRGLEKEIENMRIKLSAANIPGKIKFSSILKMNYRNILKVHAFPFKQPYQMKLVQASKKKFGGY